ncbi:MULTISPECIES: putative toxin-antitoxin system toxin component, PIN family [unclassified Imperialibacter]|uniref:putative toxin-antitoxin system toxin component, PIN family n=1 Tax=unclassified Imperialibacter TaxID=2629706 RepID=UPI001258E2F1|nr:MULTISPECIES: putative toxin-antitoxin system toxin component, PIN family [unclassified Imperialibacter]CAD5253989.1 PilT domain-containing protein [Imperialibacter sp. 89]CAD5275074.1 PilT domain-containing protein [Imperialibacter sp. 75]VVT19423.1 putative toxin-antitoxin system toxin component, PIN family [Imperialibacter sp. EC-SDR9]
MRIVLDCNTVVSASLLEDSLSRRVVNWVIINCEILVSDEVYSEISEVLKRPKFKKYFPDREPDNLLIQIAAVAQQVETSEKITACPDPKDDMYLELAIAGQADCIVTGDKALLDLHPFRNVPIIFPAEFVRQFI